MLWAYRFLENSRVDSPALSAQLITSHVLGMSRLDLLTSFEKEISPNDLSKVVSLIKERSLGKPVAYLLKKKEFYGREFYVDQNVLIPRPETEMLIDLAKEFLDKTASFLFLDIGTGCGNIALTMACEFPNSTGIGTDISIEAIKIAKKNSLTFKIKKRVSFICADLAHGLKKNLVDVVLSNPPYVGYKDFMSLKREVRCFEPYRALIGGKAGWEFYVKLFDSIFAVLKNRGFFLVEIDELIKKEVEKVLFSKGVWKDVRFFKDLAGKYRVAYGKKL